jgi:release factor glutamine methyltransferase
MKVTSNKAIDVYKYYRDRLLDLYGSEESTSLMTIVFDHYVSLKRHEILSDTARRISESELLKIHFACKALLNQQPVQYITGTAWFYCEAFKVTPDVLIPRPETEELCDWIIKDTLSTFTNQSPIRILDIGTGSGCIAITLKQNIEKAFVTALDISEKALEVAKTNAAVKNVEIEFVKADILQPEQWPEGPFDIIVSNPPYVRESEKELMKPNVLEHEPHTALFVSNEQPLVFYDAIANLALQSLTVQGKLFFEINENLQDDLTLLLQKKRLQSIEFRNDLNHKVRMVSCNLNQETIPS